MFQRLTQSKSLEEGQYITVWKIFVLSAVGNWVLDIAEGVTSSDLSELDAVLQALGLRSKDDSPQTIFSLVANFLRSLTSPKSAEIALTITEAGWPVIAPKIEFHSITPTDYHGQTIIFSEDALRLLNRILAEHDIKVWFALDRLDEAFAGFASVEIPALRALLRTFLDFNEFTHIKLKLFLRNDLFRKIIAGGFVNLTHVNSRRIEIRWSDEDLKAMLCSRFRDNADFISRIGSAAETDDNLFTRLFPDKVDTGERKPKTWQWILNRIRDGNSIKPPRNLIDLIIKTRDAQGRREERESREWNPQQRLFESESLRRGLEALSSTRVNDTLLAESGNLATFIEKFRNRKAEQNEESLSDVLGVAANELAAIQKELVEIGFLEQVGKSVKIPILY